MYDEGERIEVIIIDERLDDQTLLELSKSITFDLPPQIGKVVKDIKKGMPLAKICNKYLREEIGSYELIFDMFQIGLEQQGGESLVKIATTLEGAFIDKFRPGNLYSELTPEEIEIINARNHQSRPQEDSASTQRLVEMAGQIWGDSSES